MLPATLLRRAIPLIAVLAVAVTVIALSRPAPVDAAKAVPAPRTLAAAPSARSSQPRPVRPTDVERVRPAQAAQARPQAVSPKAQAVPAAPIREPVGKAAAAAPAKPEAVPTPSKPEVAAAAPARAAARPATPAFRATALESKPKPPVVEVSARPSAVAAGRSTAASTTPVRQLRGLWIDAFGPGFKTPAQVRALIDDARAIGANALFVQAVKRGDCYCDRAVYPRTSDPDVAPGFDPLAAVVEGAHAAGIQVHAWVIATAIGRTDGPPLPAGHALIEHGPEAGDQSWITYQEDGNSLSGKDYVLDPGNPDAAAYVARATASLATEYDLDGIQLDRIRYPEDPTGLPGWGYNPGALARFQADSGRADKPQPGDAEWTAWRRARVTDLVRETRDAVKAARPNAWFSAATIAFGDAPASLDGFHSTRTYAEVLQDWPSWMAEGLLDLNVVMDYKREAKADQAAAFLGWARFAAANAAGSLTAVGAATYLNDLDGSLAQAAKALNLPGVSGWVGYSYRTPDAATYAAGADGRSAFKRLADRLRGEGGAFAGPATWGRPGE